MYTNSFLVVVPVSKCHGTRYEINLLSRNHAYGYVFIIQHMQLLNKELTCNVFHRNQSLSTIKLIPFPTSFMHACNKIKTKWRIKIEMT